MPTDFIGLFAMLAAARIRFVLVGGLPAAGACRSIALADPEQRREWQTVRSMKVFSFWDSSNTRSTVDIMLSPYQSGAMKPRRADRSAQEP